LETRDAKSSKKYVFLGAKKIRDKVIE